ncbi:MAG: hypothetical protein BWY85_01473 [Firmicutes bacterium ADurb.Bin506]|nr:MAG: hypothetical protein BWY85_01473 [Firmicutes bacterium ADurb.Bin506]
MSAVLVKMPPPALAKSARELAPKLNPSTDVASPVSISTAATPSKLVPTTARPMTAPPLKAVMKDGSMPFLAASAAFTLAMVAT